MERVRGSVAHRRCSSGGCLPGLRESRLGLTCRWPALALGCELAKSSVKRRGGICSMKHEKALIVQPQP